MYTVIGTIIIFALIAIIISWYSKDGILFFCNYSRMAVIIWMLGLGLYDLALSKIYHPSFSINFVCIIIILNFILLCFIIPSDINKIYEIFSSIKKPKSKSYKRGVYIVLILGIISFVVNYKSGNLRYFNVNKAAVTDIKLSYFLNMMVPVSLYFYYLFRTNNINNGKIKYLVLCVVSLFLIFCNFSRGPIQYWITGFLFFELANYSSRRHTKRLTTKQLIFIVVILIVGIWGFGYIGDVRTKSIYLGGTNRHYLMKNEDMPSGFTWVYIYLTSPLENAKYLIDNWYKFNLTLGNNLCYPIIKLLANLLGMGNQYSQWLSNTNSNFGYLWNLYGLNVCSFIKDACYDFGIIGIFIYLLFYDSFALLLHKIIRSSKISDISKSIIIPIFLQITIWSIFDDSVFRIAIIWVDIICVIVWENLQHIKFTKG